MNTKELQEVIDAVSNINEELYEKLGPENTKLLYIIIEPYTMITSIEIGEYQLWRSDEDNREWMEQEKIWEHGGQRFQINPAGYEPIEPYLRKKINELIDQLSKIQL